jgi:hypothetical protein
MAASDEQPRLRRLPLGFWRGEIEALQARLATTEQVVAELSDENDTLTSELSSARLALNETAGWSERLPVALGDLANLAAGKPTDEDTQARLAAAVLELAGEHLIAKVDVSIGQPAGQLYRDTDYNENGRPIRTIVRLGACSVNCTWQPAAEAGLDTALVIEGLCAAVVCSLAGVATTRVARHEVTQLGDERALSRHLALRHRLQQPCELVAVSVDEQSSIAHSELFGRLAWTASLADLAAKLDRLARAHGGQAYHTADREFQLLVDAEDAEPTRELAETALEDYDGLIFSVSVVRR